MMMLTRATRVLLLSLLVAAPLLAGAASIRAAPRKLPRYSEDCAGDLHCDVVTKECKGMVQSGAGAPCDGHVKSCITDKMRLYVMNERLAMCNIDGVQANEAAAKSFEEKANRAGLESLSKAPPTSNSDSDSFLEVDRDAAGEACEAISEANSKVKVEIKASMQALGKCAGWTVWKESLPATGRPANNALGNNGDGWGGIVKRR